MLASGDWLLAISKMKKVSFILNAIAMTAMLASSCGGGASNEVTAYDETIAYNMVSIGGQVWMAENLNVDKFRNGHPIPQAQTNEAWEEAGKNGQPAWCYYDNQAIQREPGNNEKYGKLYNWYAVNDYRGLAPEGWHIPSDDEWSILTNHLGGEESAGLKMKSSIEWEDNGNGTNESGYSALPGGIRYFTGYFGLIGKYGTATGGVLRNTLQAMYGCAACTT